VIGVPGASAQAEFERRSARDRANRTEALLNAAIWSIAVGVFVVALFQGILHADGSGVAILAAAVSFVGRLGPRMSTTAWSTGAAGEMRTADLIDQLADEGFVVMHDLKPLMARWNIDHLVIGPTGVFVVETKNVKGNVRIDGGTVRMGGRRVAVIDEVDREVRQVESVLAPRLDLLGVRVEGLVVVHRADLPWFRRTVNQVRFLYPGQLAGYIRKRPAVLSEVEIAGLPQLAEMRLPIRRNLP